MDEKVTAEWARKQSEIEVDKVIATQLSMCEELIKKRVSFGKTDCNVHINMLKGTGDILRDRGFEVKTYQSSDDGEYFKISW